MNRGRLAWGHLALLHACDHILMEANEAHKMNMADLRHTMQKVNIKRAARADCLTYLYPSSPTLAARVILRAI